MDDLTGKTWLGRYRIEAKLGEGGMAVVYRAYDRARRARVAIKALKPDYAEDVVFIERFGREARRLQALQHPNIVRCFDFVEDGPRAALILEYIGGLTLRAAMRQRPQPFSPAETLACLRPLCQALSYAHQQGVIHCDIKPANVMLASGRVVISDFGVARASDSATVTFSTPGTAAYMAPEQWRSGDPVSPATDVYALGVTLYEMLTGRLPFTGASGETRETVRARVMREHLDLIPPPPSELNPALPPVFDHVILRCLAKDPARRYPGADELLKSFQTACRRANVGAERATRPVMSARPGRSGSMISSGWPVLGVGGMVVIWIVGLLALVFSR